MEILDLKRGTFPVIISPNLGQPKLINLKDFKNERGEFVKKVVFEALIITSSKENVQDILNNFHLNLFIQPILKDEGKFSERRGERFLLQPLEIKRIDKLNFKEQAVLEEENLVYWDIFENMLDVKNLFGERENLYKIYFKIKKIKNIDKLLREFGRKFLIFDIVHDVPNKIENKINFHSIAIFDKDWTEFKFIHASDLHIARRNDFLLKFIKNKAELRINRYEKKKKVINEKKSFVLTRKFEFKEEIQDDKIEELEFSKLNYNYNLRLLIDFVNKKVTEDKLDFVLFSGDLIDYIDIARGDDQYKNNFFVFLYILLGLSKGSLIDEEFLNKKEIMAPIFTLVGNHDYRKGHYSIGMGPMRKRFGMTKYDVRGYKDIKPFNYFKALYSKKKFLKDYFRHFNANLNYKIRIGDGFNFVFLDTGQDSIADIHDLIKGAPSTKGLKDYQIDMLRQFIKLVYNEKIIIVMHTTPISPNMSYLKKRKLKRKFKLKRKLIWSDFFESKLKEHFGSSRLDKILNLKYETIMYNWSTFLKICTGSDKMIQRKVDAILCGHTHSLNEYNLKEVKDNESENIRLGFYFTPVYIEVPCKIFTNNYAEIINNFQKLNELKPYFDSKKPFIFQSQAVGPLSSKLTIIPPGFRYYSIEQNQITKIKIYSLHLN